MPLQRTSTSFLRLLTKTRPLTTHPLTTRPLTTRFFSKYPPLSSSPKTPYTPPLYPKSVSNNTPLKPKHERTEIPPPPARPRPEYEMTFTCKPCSTRSTHRISKQGYHYGSVLITCPECRNRHVISDHLNIFGDRKLTVEDLMKERGQLVKKGTLSEDGDVEFWEDGTSTQRKERAAQNSEAEVDGEQVKDDMPYGSTFGKA